MPITIAPAQPASPAGAASPQRLPNASGGPGSQEQFLLAYLLARQTGVEPVDAAQGVAAEPATVAIPQPAACDGQAEPREDPSQLAGQPDPTLAWFPPGMAAIAAKDADAAPPSGNAGSARHAAAPGVAASVQATARDGAPDAPQAATTAPLRTHAHAIEEPQVQSLPGFVPSGPASTQAEGDSTAGRQHAPAERAGAQALPPPMAAAPNGIAGSPLVAPPAAAIASRVGSPQWTHDLTERVSLMVNNGTSVAELSLTPADMGPIEIRIDFSDSSPTLSISAQHADTRAALDLALPRLREMLSESGMTLGGATVEQRDGGQQHAAGEHGAKSQAMPGDPLADSPPEFGPWRRTGSAQRLVDTYA